jgi:hypothetical protein
MINGDLASSILYTVAGALFVAAVVFALIAWWAMRDSRGRIGLGEQMRERTPWPPPLQDSGWVEVVYDRQPRPQVRAQPLALPRGES